ncbi:MAG: methionine--tRNA ligase subunit beta [Candidatus Campbellbacteria bacterium]|nr:methionine--tRNA ligase subunit beta [Candidatus Campbellbacteria bacterium]
MITIDQLKTADIRIGQILSAEEVPETDKLLRLTVSFGEETPRQIISGIKQYVADIQTLVGKKTAFVVNLEPRTIKGLESNGMLFAVSTGEGEERQFSFIVPERDIPPGARLG